jgi:hypothetical protein
MGVLALSAPLILACGKEGATYSPPDTASSDIARLQDESQAHLLAKSQGYL